MLSNPQSNQDTKINPYLPHVWKDKMNQEFERICQRQKTDGFGLEMKKQMRCVGKNSTAKQKESPEYNGAGDGGKAQQSK